MVRFIFIQHRKQLIILAIQRRNVNTKPVGDFHLSSSPITFCEKQETTVYESCLVIIPSYSNASICQTATHAN